MTAETDPAGLRVLHIGNIANNAYNNARLLNEAGLDCDVLCYDYYHIQGCPEWEDARVNGNVVDADFPRWWNVRLDEYRRPRWFAQAPRDLCIAYLLARRSGRRWRARYLWAAMARDRLLWSLAEYRELRRDPTRWRALASTVLRGRLGIARDEHTNALDEEEHAASWWGHLLFTICLAWFALVLWIKALRTRLGWRERSPWEEIDDSGNMAKPTLDGFLQSIPRFQDRFHRRFPGREDQLREEDLLPYAGDVPAWRALFACYDVVVAYATCAIFPVLAGKQPIVAYEHGTIRDIPFTSDSQGRLTALSYAESNALYLTNADSIAQAETLIGAERVVHGLHGFDERRLENWLRGYVPSTEDAYRRGLPTEMPVFFAPARHQWRGGASAMRKGNDRIVDAVARLIEEYDKPFVVIFVAWGREVHLTKERISSMGLDGYFHWVPPLAKADLWAAYASATGILDQFLVPCIGGIAMEAFAMGRAPVITHLDTKLMASHFGACPPALNCSTPEEIAAAMLDILTGAKHTRDLPERGRRWVQEHHSHRVLIETHLEAYRLARELPRDPIA